MSRKTVVVGISGPSGSGKSTLAAALQEQLPGAVTVCADTFFKKELPLMISPLDGRTYPDWNHPDSIDREAFLSELLRQKASGVPYVLADGAFLFCLKELSALLDYRVFVKASIEMRLYRRICRNIVTKHQTPEFIGGYYLACTRYREAEFSCPSERFADMVIENENGFGDSVRILAEKVRTMNKNL